MQYPPFRENDFPMPSRSSMIPARPRRVLSCALTALVLLGATLEAEKLTEREALIRALADHTQIQLLRIDKISDSLQLTGARAGWQPAVTLGADVRSTSTDTFFVPRTAGRDTAAASAAVSRKIPGGGTISGEVAEEVDLSSNNAGKHATSWEVTCRQPLLKDAWRFGEQDMRLRIARLDSRGVDLRLMKDLLADLSVVRRAYWKWYEQYALREILTRERDLALSRLERERARFLLGEASELDTLSASLEYLESSSRLTNASYELDAAGREVALLLDIDQDTVVPDTAREIRTADLPSSEELVERAERFDPELKIFAVLEEKLQLEKEELANNLLPSVSLDLKHRAWSRDRDRPLSTDENRFGSSSIGVSAAYTIPATVERIAVHGKRLEARRNALSREHYRRELLSRLTDTREQWRRDRANLVAARKAEEVARKKLDAARRGYELGTVDRLSLIEARNDATRTSVSRLQKERALKDIEIVFDEITGDVLDKFGLEWE